MSYPPENADPQGELQYESAAPYGSAPMLIRLATIFTLVSAGLSVIGALYMAAMAFFMPMFMKSSGPPGSPPPPAWVFSSVYGLFRALALCVAILKLIAGLKLLRNSVHVWGWTLAASIAGCLEMMWCSLGCVLPLGAAIYCIVVLCQPNVQDYLRARGRTLPGMQP